MPRNLSDLADNKDRLTHRGKTIISMSTHQRKQWKKLFIANLQSVNQYRQSAAE